MSIRQRDYRDLTIEHLTADKLELLDRLRDLEADLQSYRELALAGVHALHHLTRERDHLHVRLLVLLEELRALDPTRRAA